MDDFRKMQASCRTCGSENDPTISIYELQVFGNTEVIVCDVIMKCASVQVHREDGLPQQMCKKCLEELNTAVCFKKRCEETDLRLRLKLAQFATAIGSLCSPVLRIKTEFPVSRSEIVEQDVTDVNEMKQEPEGVYLNKDLEFSRCTTPTAAKTEEPLQFNMFAPYRCEECNLNYDGLASFETHMESKHSNFSEFGNAVQNTESESEAESLEPTSPDIAEAAAGVASLNALPERSKKKYEASYKIFMDWRRNQDITSYSEDVMMTYFRKISKQYKPSSLWTHYSMLRTILSNNKNVDIATYNKLRAFLKKQADDYKPAKTKFLTSSEINRFIKEAPDEEYLMTKVVLIMWVMGACRKHELHQMKTTNFTDLGSCVLVTVPDRKANVERTFKISGYFYEIFKKYTSLRSPSVSDSYFFLNYRNGRCTSQKVGINKFGQVGKQIAKFLKLPSPDSYTSHCFRGSSKKIVVDVSEDILNSVLNRHCGLKTTAVVEDSTENDDYKIQISVKNTRNMPSTSKMENCEN